MNAKSQKSITEKFGTSTSTLTTILKNGKDIEECTPRCGEKAVAKRKIYENRFFFYSGRTAYVLVC